MSGYREPGSKPTEQGGEYEQADPIAPLQAREAKAGRIKLSERAEIVIQQQHGYSQHAPSHEAAGQSLQSAEIQERAPNEGVGCPDQLGDLDLLAPGQDLQTDRIERYCHQRG